MRRDWFSTPAAVALAAAVLAGPRPCAATGSAQVAAEIESTAKAPMLMAQAAGVPPALASASDSSAAAPAEASSPAAATKDVPTSPSAEGTMPKRSTKAVRSAKVSDEQQPTAAELAKNPYLIQGVVSAGDTVVSGDISPAYVPPPQPTLADKVEAAGQEMRGIIGEEAYNRRVNINTPPDTDVAEVVRLLSEAANLNFVYGENVFKGKVTLYLKDVPLGAALQSLLSSQNLVIVREGDNVFRISPRQEVSGGKVELRTIYIRLNWIPADSVLNAVKSVASTDGKAQTQLESNTVVVTDTPTNVQVIRDLIQQLDVPDKQVMIEARMVEVFLDNARAQGANTTVERANNNGATNNNQTIQRPYAVQDPLGSGNLIATPANLLLPVDSLRSSLTNNATNPSLAFGAVANVFGRQYNISAALDALERQNAVNTLTNPRIITLNNQKAEIDIKKEIPYLEAQQGAAQGIVQAVVKFKDAGVRLNVTPNITNNGFVRLKIESEQSIRSGDFASPQGVVPIIDRRKANTNVIVKDEDTVVIGGLRQIASFDSKQEVPWLGKAPVFGWFFKNSSKSHSKNDLMLFVTPHIVKAPILAPAENYKYSRIDNHWDLPDYFFDDSVESREGSHRGSADMSARNFYPQGQKLPVGE